MNIADCSQEAQLMWKNKKGYRDDNLFGENYHNPVEVLIHEIMELENLSILKFIYTQHIDKMSMGGHIIFKSIMDYTDINDLINDYFDGSDEKMEEFLTEELTYILEGRNYCVWLCATPTNVVDAYIEPMIENGNEDYAEYKDNMKIAEYDIPNSAIILDDVEMDGALWCWKK